VLSQLEVKEGLLRVGDRVPTADNTHFPRRGLRPLATAVEVIGLA
jgi:hypothetical protein